MRAVGDGQRQVGKHLGVPIGMDGRVEGICETDVACVHDSWAAIITEQPCLEEVLIGIGVDQIMDVPVNA